MAVGAGWRVLSSCRKRPQSVVCMKEAFIMLRAFARLLKVGVMAGLMLAGLAPSTASQQQAWVQVPLALMHPEVRLRKLHLVRPDLIPYPIAYEVVC